MNLERGGELQATGQEELHRCHGITLVTVSRGSGAVHALHP